ncbi:hypothetical protein GC105_08340 [Alkalibaculum sp. M08DMB]|uniref:Peptidase M56 domain-containing protein n=1 Tax=Alkalibaculum sporogenes TaxID=2655001 RepID=A0A6A7K9D0_9FIRM|nr:M56 family metallopeptidase [Alkalibaculum sporogenes]MPW25797.1 hypothetical protein [Alkalibaculum sporogenes]
MKDIFFTVLNMSLMASYVTIVVLIFRSILIFFHSPKLYSYILWAVVFFRLVSPFSFYSQVSLLPPSNNLIYTFTERASDIEAIEMNPTWQSNGKIGVSQNLDTFQQSKIPHLFTLSIVDIILLVWIAGIFAFLFYGITSYRILKKQVAIATCKEGNIFESDQIKTPFVLGVLKPRIYIPMYLNEIELSYILKHEQIHIKRKDHLIQLLSAITLVVHWFNPIVWICYFLMIRDMEMSCDESVLKKYEEDIRTNYSKTLLAINTSGNQQVSLFFKGSSIKQRIKNILQYRRKTEKTVLVISVVLLILSLSLLLNSPQDILNSTNSENNHTSPIDPTLSEIKVLLIDIDVNKEITDEERQTLLYFKLLLGNELTEHYAIKAGSPVFDFPKPSEADLQTLKDSNMASWELLIMPDIEHNISYIEKIQGGVEEIPILYNWLDEAKNLYMDAKNNKDLEEAYYKYIKGGMMFNDLLRIVDEDIIESTKPPQNF